MVKIFFSCLNHSEKTDLKKSANAFSYLFLVTDAYLSKVKENAVPIMLCAWANFALPLCAFCVLASGANSFLTLCSSQRQHFTSSFLLRANQISPSRGPRLGTPPLHPPTHLEAEKKIASGGGVRPNQRGLRSSSDDKLPAPCDITGRQLESPLLAPGLVFTLVAPLNPTHPPPRHHQMKTTF